MSVGSSNRLPDDRLRRELDRGDADFAGPLDRLRFVRASVDAYQSAPELLKNGKRSRAGARMALAEARAQSNRPGVFGDRLLRIGYRGAGVLDRLGRTVTGRKLVFILGLLAVMAGVAAAPSMLRRWRPAAPESPAPVAASAIAPVTADDIWLVESGPAGELYSNGLRIADDYLTHNRPRRWTWLPPSLGPAAVDALEDPDWRNLPAGIVFHTTVSDSAPPLARQNNQLLRNHGDKLLKYIAREQLYNFVIDRFGRVFRIVPEDEYAYHAGFSVWADDQAAYLDLNEPFLGVAFETRPEAIRADVRPEAAVTEAQVESARRLTAMLRERYGIPAANCVTHEMVSVNPDNKLVGYHTDWAGRFPFEALGLPDNYRAPWPAVAYWGFAHDASFERAMSGSLPSGVEDAETLFAADARARALSAGELRRVRARDYDVLRARLREVKSSDPEAVRSHQ